MIKTNIHCRLTVTEHSLREHRMLRDVPDRRLSADGYLPPNDDMPSADQQDQETSEHRFERWKLGGAEATGTGISDIMKRTHENVVVIDPQLELGALRESDILWDLVSVDGIMDREMGELLKSKASSVNLTMNEKETNLQELMSAKPKNVGSILWVIRNNIESAEELSQMLEKRLKVLGMHDPAMLQKKLEELRDTSTSEEKFGVLTEAGITKQDVQRIAEKISGQKDAAKELTDRTLDAVINFLWNTVIIRKRQSLFAERTGKENPYTSDARADYIRTLKQQEECVEKYLKAMLQSKIKLIGDRLKLYYTQIGRKGAGMDVKDFDRAYGLEDRMRDIEGLQAKIEAAAGLQRGRAGGKKPIDFESLMTSLGTLETLEREVGSLPSAGKTELGSDAEDVNFKNNVEQSVEEGNRNEDMAVEIAKSLKHVRETNTDPAATAELDRMWERYQPYAAGLDSIERQFTSQADCTVHRMSMRQMPYHHIQRDLITVSTLTLEPTYFSDGLAKQEAARKNHPNTKQGREELRQLLGTSITGIQKQTQGDIARVLSIGPNLAKQNEVLEAQLRDAEKHPDITKREQMFLAAATEIRELAAANRLLGETWVVEIDKPTVFEKITQLQPGIAMNTYGYYVLGTGKIYLNMSSVRRDKVNKQRVIEHERNHAFIDVMCRRTKALPGLLVHTRMALDNAASEQGTTAEELLKTFAKECKIDMTHPGWRELTMDEAAVVCADYLGGKKKTLTDAQKNVLRTLGLEKSADDGIPDHDSLRQTTPKEQRAKSGKQKIGQRMAADDIQEGYEPESGAVETKSTEAEGEYPFLKNLDEVKWKLDRIDDFMKVYPQNLQADAGEGQNYEQYINEIKKRLKVTENLFTQKNVADDRQEKILQQMIEDLDFDTGDIMKAIKEFDSKRMDMTHVAPSTKRTLFQKASERIVWCSLSDIWGMIKDAGEDINRMWKRRSEDARAKLGRAVTATFIPEKIPYFGRLQYDFRGREKHSEEEEVGVWEKRFGHIDNHALQHMLVGQTDKDKVKAIINLLTKRGRMDFEDDQLWYTLERLSKYGMPHDACHRDNILRNAYLQKLIAQIWDDKDQFEHWKTANDSAIKKGKDSFAATVDDLSSLPKGQASALARLLEAWDKQKDHGAKVSPEEEVNPHLFEEHIHYAMRNGKMGMEDKFFYLIQGVARGLLNVDRLRSFNGQEGKILNAFPFIDFFDKKNNTLDEIRTIAESITNKKAPYTPDYRTTYLLYEEVRRNKAVRDRAAKGIKNSQNVDHEDLPMLISLLDYGNINQATGIAGGQLWRVSAPAMKNIYVGYNSLFQYYAIRARMILEGVSGVKPLTMEDITAITTALVAFIHYDNLITRAADTGSRPYLTWNEINNDPPVSGTLLTKNYRDKATGFAKEIVKDKLGIAEITTKEGNVTIDDAIGVGRDAATVDELGATKKKVLMSQACQEDLTKNIKKNLTKAFKENPQQILKWLAKFTEDPSKTLHPEEEEFTYSNIKSIVPTWRQAVPQTHAIH